jgi:hypothetical protein
MATGKRYYWMKLRENFMTSDTIDYFMSQPDGANYVVLYQMLCLKTINTEGRLSRKIGEIIIPYDIPKIQRDMKWFSVDTIRVALDLFKAFGLIYEDVDGVLSLADYHSLVGSESDYAKQKKLQRKNNRPELGVDIVHTNVHTEIEIRDKRLEKEIDIEDSSSSLRSEELVAPEAAATPQQEENEHIPYAKVQKLYNDLCPKMAKCTVMSEARKKAIKARFRSGYKLEDFERLFTLAAQSSFLNGGNKRNFMANFDWLIRDANMAKVLDGNYADRAGGNNSPDGGGFTYDYGDMSGSL